MDNESREAVCPCVSMLGTVAALGLSHSMEEWLGLANLIATLLHHWGRAFDQAPSECSCLCKVDTSAGAAPVDGYSGALDRCLTRLASASPASSEASSPSAAPLCALVPASAWAALGSILFVVGLVTGLSCGACWFGAARVRRTPAGAELRPGAFTGPVSPASLCQLQQ